MEFAYYPGCSLESTAKPYDQSCREVFKVLDVGLKEVDDWNCCGATMYMSVDNLVAYSVSARNLAIAKQSGCKEICAPCSSCYTILQKTNKYIEWDPHARALINDALSAAKLSYSETIKVRHPLDILVNDVGIEEIVKRAPYRLDGIKVAPYYGCQIVRPEAKFDDMDNPTTMDRLLTALGAEVVDYPAKVRCCGGMLMTTFTDVALNLNNDIILSAKEAGAEVIATVCPLCQMNVESYQSQINAKFGENHRMPTAFFTQLVGLALGISPKQLGLDTMLIPVPARRVRANTEGAAL
jgi:heterodisulfide reductase subunit B2